MFILKSTYLEYLESHVATLKEYRKLEKKWNDLVDRINEKGGEQFLNSTQFTKSNIRELIILCHPDKHNNSDLSTRVTKKLLEAKLQEE